MLRIPQSSSITGTSPSDCLLSYPGYSFVGGVLPLCRDAVGVFYCLSRLGKLIVGFFWDDFKFHIWLRFLFMPFCCCLRLSVGSCKRMKDGRKETKILFNSNFILRFNDYSVVWMFSCTSRNSRVSQTKH